MYCSTCGSELTGTERVCPACGTPAGGVSQGGERVFSAGQESLSSAGDQLGVYKQYLQQLNKAQKEYSRQIKKMRKRLTCLTALTAAAAALAAAALILTFIPEKYSQEDSAPAIWTESDIEKTDTTFPGNSEPTPSQTPAATEEQGEALGTSGSGTENSGSGTDSSGRETDNSGRGTVNSGSGTREAENDESGENGAVTGSSSVTADTESAGGGRGSYGE